MVSVSLDAVLPRPAFDLAGEIIAGLAIVAEARRLVVGSMERGERIDHRIVDAGALIRRIARKRPVPQIAPLHQRHDVEDRADDVFVLAQPIRAGDREAGGVKTRDQAIFAVHRMGGRQQLAEGLATQDIGARRAVEPIGRIGLAASELGVAERAGEAGDVRLHPRGQSVEVEAILVRHGDDAGCFGHTSGPGRVSRKR
jgi:hypothetical protein